MILLIRILNHQFAGNKLLSIYEKITIKKIQKSLQFEVYELNEGIKQFQSAYKHSELGPPGWRKNEVTFFDKNIDFEYCFDHNSWLLPICLHTSEKNYRIVSKKKHVKTYKVCRFTFR